MTIPGNAVAYDSFGRTSASGWTTSTSGHAWSSIGAGGTITATDWTVDGTGGHHKVPASGAYRYTWLSTVSMSDVDESATGSVALSGGTPLTARVEILGVMWRVVDSSHYYMARLNVETDSTLSLYIYGIGGVEVAHELDVLSGATYTAGTALSIRVQAYGSRIRAKAWLTSGGEPTAWDMTVYDGVFVGSGGVGLRTGVGSGNTNTKPVVSSFTEFWVAPNTVHGGGAFLTNVFGGHSLAYLEIAPGADLTADPSTWTFVDITSDLRHDPGVSVTKGRPDEAAQAQPSKFGCVLGNKSANYTPRRANSTYYPYMRRDLPIRWQIDPGTGISERFAGFVDTNVPSWDVSAKISICTIAASGLLQRLNQGDAPLRSALYRSMFAANPDYYWPMEDAGTSTFAAEASGKAPLTVLSGTPVFGATGVGTGTAAAVDHSLGGGLSVALRPVTGPWRIAFSVRAFWNPTTGNSRPVSWTTSDGAQWTIDFHSVNPQIEYRTATVSSTAALGYGINFFDNNFHTLVVEAYQNGSDIQVAYYQDGTNEGSGLSSFVASATLSPLAAIATNFKRPDGTGTESDLFELSHLGVWGNIPAFTGTQGFNPGLAGQAYISETPDDRLARICDEENIPIAITGNSTDAMGVQPLDTLINVLRQCEVTDGGVLGDGQNFGLTYVCRSSRYNSPVAIALVIPDGHIADPFAPVDDDQGAMNDVTVTQFTTGDGQGTSARATDDGDIAAHGRYQSSFTVNTQTTVPLFIKASWAVHIGTVDVERYPSVNLDLAAAPEIAPTWLTCIEGSRLTIDGLPVEAPDGQVDNLIEGYTEKITLTDWDVTLNCSPALGWTVAVIQDAVTPWRVDSDDSTLTSDITTTAASFQVSSVHIWTTTATFPADFPFDIEVGGEQITVTGITGTSSPQTFAVARSINGVVKNHHATDPVSLWRPAVIAQ